MRVALGASITAKRPKNRFLWVDWVPGEKLVDIEEIQNYSDTLTFRKVKVSLILPTLGLSEMKTLFVFSSSLSNILRCQLESSEAYVEIWILLSLVVDALETDEFATQAFLCQLVGENTSNFFTALSSLENFMNRKSQIKI